MFSKFAARSVALLLAIGAICALPNVASAQTISQTSGDSQLPGPGVGQSFTATLTGTVTRIDFRGRSNTTTTLNFYNGSNGSGVAGSVGVPLYQQAVVLTDTGSNAAGFTSITLTTPFPVVAGQTYSFVFSAGNTAFTFSNPYAGGSTISNFRSTGWTSNDSPFQVYEVAAPPPAPVPTMSEWAMILFGLILAVVAGLYIQRRHTAA